MFSPASVEARYCQWYEIFKKIAHAIETEGYAILPGGLPSLVVEELGLRIKSLSVSAMQQAGIGRGQELLHNGFVRQDRIDWLEEEDPSLEMWHEWTRQLMAFLNRRLFLGLFSFESHMACYPPGAFYKTHLDAFQGQSNRRLSLVTYLNPGWEPDQGGELVLYPPSGKEPLVRVVPALGTLVLFLSEQFPHEVLPACRHRYSVAGWFRVNASTSERSDPPC